jgi:hypothetical protein
MLGGVAPGVPGCARVGVPLGPIGCAAPGCAVWLEPATTGVPLGPVLTGVALPVTGNPFWPIVGGFPEAARAKSPETGTKG